MMGTEIFNFDASLAEKLTKTRVSFLAAPTVIVKRMRMVVRWMDVVVIIISDYGHCTLNAVTASALD